MSAAVEIITALIAGGMHAVDAAALLARAAMEMAPPTDTRSAGAKRQSAWRERNKASQNVSLLHEAETSQNVSNRNETSQSNAASLSKKERIERKEEREPRKARASQLPDGWHPGENAWQASVARLGEPRATTELQKFKNHAADKGRVSKSWDAAWRNWVDRALDYGGGMGTKGNSNGRRTVQDAARDLHEQTIAGVLAFDDPAPTGIRDGAGPAPLRLIPSR